MTLPRAWFPQKAKKMDEIAVEFRTLCSSDGFGSGLLTQYKNAACARSKKVSKNRPKRVLQMAGTDGAYYEETLSLSRKIRLGYRKVYCTRLVYRKLEKVPVPSALVRIWSSWPPRSLVNQWHRLRHGNTRGRLRTVATLAEASNGSRTGQPR